MAIQALKNSDLNSRSSIELPEFIILLQGIYEDGYVVPELLEVPSGQGGEALCRSKVNQRRQKPKVESAEEGHVVQTTRTCRLWLLFSCLGDEQREST